ncbi:MAG: hypothetical protein ABIO70_15870 [Pseudomonadota bacterium]
MQDLASALRALGFISYLDWATSSGMAEVGMDRPDFASPDGSLLVEVKVGQGGARDLRAAVAHLALHAKDSPEARLVLLFVRPRMSPAGLRAEWNRLRTVLAPEIASRLGLVALLAETVVVAPDDATLRGIAEAASKISVERRRSRVDRSYEVMRVLLARWLLGQGRIAIGELQRQTGLSHPSVSKGLEALGDVVERTADRGVVLRSFPRERWSQLLALAPTVRQTAAFVDESGRGGDPQRLLDRLTRAWPAGVAVSGVVAARRWHPGFDLHGFPRLDLSVHAPEGHMDRGFVETLDPALVPAPVGVPPLLVLHAIPRAENLFTPGSSTDPPMADPVEVLLDLHELRLAEQADSLLRHLRKATR